MLKSIRQLDKKAREGILSEIALELGRPSLEGAYSLDYFSSEEEAAAQNPTSLLTILRKTWTDPNDVRLRTVEEMIGRLNLRDTNQFHEAKSRLLEFVGKEIRGLALESRHISDVRKRLGQKGMLSSNAYQIKFGDDFNKFCESLGVTKNEIRHVIESPDMFEHFIPEVVINETYEAISLYVKSYSKDVDPYSVLVDARRVGDELIVHFALKVFHSDIDVSDVARPTDLLKLFTDLYGSEVSIDDQEGRFFQSKIVDGSSYRLSIRGSQPHYVARVSHRLLENGKREIAIAYGVNVKRYAESLRSHGIRTKELDE